MNVGGNIKRIRLNRGMSQKEIAVKAEITQALLSQIEKGVKNPSLQTGKLIADALCCTLEELLED